MSGLPVIDIEKLSSNSLSDRKAEANTLRNACLKNGFFYAANTGVGATTTANLLAASRAYFALPDSIKLTISKEQSSCGRGYEGLSRQRLEAGAQPDLKEGFVMGTHLSDDDPRVRAGWTQHGPNMWLPGDHPGRAVVERYHAEMSHLARRLMRGLALSLDIPEDYFDDCCRDSISTVRLLHYPPQPANASADARGAGAHTDWGAITILLQDDVGGLQVHNGDNDWIDVRPVPGTFIVNLGDLVPRWTNGLYRSTVHRVINRSGRERYSAAFFFDGRGDYVSECIPTCLAEGEFPKYPPLSVMEHLAEMYRLTRAA